MSSLNLESTVSHYKIKQLLGRGGMGEVYKAVDLQLGRMVALKTLLPSLSSDQTAHQRFLREARAASILSHPSICTVFEVGHRRDLVYIAMQYIEGKTVSQILSQGRLPVETALAYALDIADALDEAHRHGVIHRDIKPSNIIVNERGIAVVLDFGLAKQFHTEMPDDETPTLSLLTTGPIIIGTVAYMSPEQVRAETIDGRSDIFSLGVLLYEMLAGSRPFEGRTRADLIHSILHDEPRRPSEFVPELDARLELIISKALKKAPGDRYQSAAEMKQEMVSFIQEKGYAIRGISTSTGKTVKREPEDPSSIFQQLFSFGGLLAIVLAVVLFGAVWWLLLRPRDRTDSQTPPSLQFVQLINWKSEPDDKISGSFSRDGKLIAFSSMRGGYEEIWLKQIAGGEPFEITRDRWNHWSPIWSSDGQKIAFVSNRGNQTGIWEIPAFGGATPTRLKALEPSWPELKYYSKDGRTIYYESKSNLFALDLASKTIRQITSFDSSKQPQKRFSISPDEDHIAYTDNRDGQIDVWVRSMRGGEPFQVTNDPAEDRYPVWHADGKRIIYSSDRSGTYQLCVAYLDGRKPAQITVGDSDHKVLDISPDGTRILDFNSRDEADVWGVSIETGEESAITSEIGVKLWPEVSPNGEMIAFQSSSDQGKLANSLIVALPLLRGQRQTQLASDGFNLRWSPDGNNLAFLRFSDGKVNIWAVRAAGGDEKQVTTGGIHTGAFSILPRNRDQTRDYSWSPDGSSIIYCSRKSGAANVWIAALDGSRETSITDNTDANVIFNCPLWSPDGKRIAYSSETEAPLGDGKPTWTVRLVEEERSTIIFQASSALRLIGWSESGEVIVAIVEGAREYPSEPTSVDLVQINAAGGKRSIVRLPSAYFSNIQLSPDKKSFAFVSTTDGRDNIWAVPATGGKPRKITRNTDPKLYFSSLSWSPDGKTIYLSKQASGSLISMIDNFK